MDVNKPLHCSASQQVLESHLPRCAFLVQALSILIQDNLCVSDHTPEFVFI
jgi:hypothetical protein